MVKSLPDIKRSLRRDWIKVVLSSPQGKSDLHLPSQPLTTPVIKGVGDHTVKIY